MGFREIDFQFADFIVRQATMPQSLSPSPKKEDDSTIPCLFVSALLLSYLTGLRNSAMDLKRLAKRPLEHCLETEEMIPATGIALPSYDAWIDMLGCHPAVVGSIPSRAPLSTMPKMSTMSKRLDGSSPFSMDGQKVPGDPLETVKAKAMQLPKTPLLLDDEGRLYLSRYLHYEECVAQTVAERSMGPSIVFSRTDLLPRLFPTASSPEIDWQMVASIAALQSGFTIISGGPGTGKTTTVSKLLALVLSEDPDIKIDLVAPTGKAADRLVKSIQSAKARLDLPSDITEKIPDSARTIHRYLQFHPGSGRFRHHRKNPQSTDLLIVDEASMVSLPLFAHLFDALKPSARIILLGDKDQLASVENGSVFADLSAEAFINRFSDDFIAQNEPFIPGLRDALQRSSPSDDYSSKINDKKQANEDIAGTFLKDRVVHLSHSYRFGSDSGIGHLSFLINHHIPSDTMAFLKTGELPKSAVAAIVSHGKSAPKAGRFEDVAWYDIPPGDTDNEAEERIRHVLEKRAVDRLQDYMNALERFRRCHPLMGDTAIASPFHRFENGHGEPSYTTRHDRPNFPQKGTLEVDDGPDQEMAGNVLSVLDAFDRFRILCALNRGPFGVENINGQMEALLFGKRQDLFYFGRPVMVLSNDYTQQLFNGDIGVILVGRDGQRRAWFRGEGDTVRGFPPAFLPAHVTAFAMTIHKSQGSEFDGVMMILPNRDTRILTREILYTGITRAKKEIAVMGSESIFKKALLRRTERTSGLKHKLAFFRR